METRDDGKEGKRGFPKGFCMGKKGDFRRDREKPSRRRILIRKMRWKSLERKE